MNGATSPSLTAASPKRPRKPKGQKQSSQLRGSSNNNNQTSAAPLSPAGRSGGGGGGASSRAAHAATRQQPQSPVRSSTNRPSAPSRTASYSPGGSAPQRQFTQQQQPNSPKRGVKASFSERSPNGRLWKRPQQQSQSQSQPHSPTRSSSTTQKNAVRASPMRQASSSLKSSGSSSTRPAPEAPPPLPAVPFDGSSSSLNFNFKSSSSSSPPTPKQPQKARKPKTPVATTTTTTTNAAAAAVTSAPVAVAAAPPSPTKPTVAFEQPSALPISKRGPLSTEKALSSILDEESESSKFPTNNSKRRVEGQRDGIAFIIVVDAPATHGGKWFKIVKATLLRPGEDDSDTDEEKAAAAAAKRKAQPPRSQKATLRKKKPGAGSAPSSPLATTTPLQVPSSAPANMTLPKLTPALAPPVRSKNPPPKKPNSRPNSRPTSPVRTSSSNNLNSRPTSPVRTTSNSRPTSPARSPKQKKATATTAAAAPANVRPPARYPSTMTAASDILDDDDDYYQDNDNDRNGGGNARYDDQDLTYRLPGTSGGNNNANNNKTKFSSAAVLARMQQRSALDRSSSAESTRSSGNGDEDIEGSAHLPMTNIDDIYADAAQPALPNKKMITRSETFEDYDDHDYAMDDFDDDDSESESVDEDDSESLDEVDSDDEEDDDDDLDLLDKSPVVLRTGDMDRSLDVMAVLTGGSDNHLYEFKGNEEAVYEFKDDSKKNLSPSRWGENKPAGGAALRRPSGIPGTSPTTTGGAPGFSTKLRRPSGAVAQKPYSPPSGSPAASGSGIRGSDKDSNARFGTSSAMMKKADPQGQVSALNSTGHSIDAASLYNSTSNLPQKPTNMIPRESFSSESSSSAYSFGVNVPGDGGSLLDQANTASYMQFSIVSEDGLYMVESGLPDSEHTRKLVDAGTADKQQQPPPGPPAESKKMSPRPEAARKPDKAKDGAPSMPARAAEALRNKMNKRSQGLLRGLQKETQQGQFQQQQQQQLSQPQQSQARDVSKRGVRRTTSNREGGPLRGLVRTLSSREVPSFFPNRGASRDNADRNRKGEVDTSRGNSVERGPIRGVMRTFSNNRRDESVERGRGLMRTFSNNNKAGNSKASRKQAASAPNTPVADKKQGFFSFASTAVGNSLNASFGSLSRDGASLLSDSSGDDDF